MHAVGTKSASLPAALPNSAHPAAVRAMGNICNAENGDLARVAAKAFAIDYGAKLPKAVAKIIDDLDVLLEFYNCPAELWVHCGPRTRSSRRSPPSGPRDHVPARRTHRVAIASASAALTPATWR